MIKTELTRQYLDLLKKSLLYELYLENEARLIYTFHKLLNKQINHHLQGSYARPRDAGTIAIKLPPAYRESGRAVAGLSGEPGCRPGHGRQGGY